jgi:hypothetical protein
LLWTKIPHKLFLFKIYYPLRGKAQYYSLKCEHFDHGRKERVIFKTIISIPDIFKE